MSEEEFIAGLEAYFSKTGSPAEPWKDWVCERENKTFFNLLIGQSSFEEVLQAWRIKNSPLAKALE